MFASSCFGCSIDFQISRAVPPVLAMCFDRNEVERRLGKIQARHPSVNDLYEVSLRDTADGVRLSWQIRPDRKNWRESREGVYLLRTNL